MSRRARPAAERFQQWTKDGVFRRIVEGLAADLQERGRLDLREAFIDGSFVSAKKEKRGGAAGRTKRGKGSGIMAIADASPHEVKLVETALDSLFIAGKPAKLMTVTSSTMIF